jgi:carbonic anhydrase
MAIQNEVLAKNEEYARTFGAKGQLAMPPARRFAILTCMDARLDPAKFAGLAEGDDAIRSLVISYKLLGTREWFVIHHTNCGMETFTDDVMRRLLGNSLKQAVLSESGWRDEGPGPGSPEAEYIDWLTIKDGAESVRADVRRIRSHPLVPKEIPVYGYIYDVTNGKLVEVPGASDKGVQR